MEPYKLRRWRHCSSPDPASIFTCARPGRSHGPQGDVPDQVVDKWVKGLPGGHRTSKLSLLGRKPDGLSEFSFYSFFGLWDTFEERRGRPSFQQWLDERHSGRGIRLLEHPTVDFKSIPLEALESAASDIRLLAAAGRTVVIVDSGGETRTQVVCRHTGLVEDPRKI